MARSESTSASEGPPAVLSKACRDLQRQISSLTRLQSASSSRTSCAIATIHAAFDKLRTVYVLIIVIGSNKCWWVGTTVFCGMRNFEPSRGICPFPRNFYVFMEFCGIRYWPVILGTNTAYFGGVQAAVLYVYMILLWNTRLPLRLWWEEYWKYWAELIWNLAILFGRQTVSVSCSYQRQILHIWSGSEATEN